MSEQKPYSFFPQLPQPEPGPMAVVLSEGLKAAFIDQGFINTMRFSELNGDEEYDNTFLYIAWHGFLSTGLQQLRAYNEDLLFTLERMEGISDEELKQFLKVHPVNLPQHGEWDAAFLALPYEGKNLVERTTDDYVAYLKKLLDNANVKAIIPYDQRMRIYRYIDDYFKAFLKIAQMAVDGERDGNKALNIVQHYLGDWNENLGVDFELFYHGHTAILNGRMARSRGHKLEMMGVANGQGQGTGKPEASPTKKKHWWSRG